MIFNLKGSDTSVAISSGVVQRFQSTCPTTEAQGVSLWTWLLISRWHFSEAIRNRTEHRCWDKSSKSKSGLPIILAWDLGQVVQFPCLPFLMCKLINPGSLWNEGINVYLVHSRASTNWKCHDSNNNYYYDNNNINVPNITSDRWWANTHNAHTNQSGFWIWKGSIQTGIISLQLILTVMAF